MTRGKLYSAGFALYMLSLFSPVWECQRNDTLSGWFVLGTGYMGLLFYDPRWLCNLCVLLSALNLPGNNRYLISTSVVLCIAATSTLWGPYFCAGGGGTLGEGIGMTYGGYSWVISLWLMSLSFLLPMKTPNKV